MRSVMKSDSHQGSQFGEDKKRPVISFKKADTTLKVLENRPVMQLPPEDRYVRRPQRPTTNSSPSTQSRPAPL